MFVEPVAETGCSGRLSSGRHCLYATRSVLTGECSGTTAMDRAMPLCRASQQHMIISPPEPTGKDSSTPQRRMTELVRVYTVPFHSVMC